MAKPALGRGLGSLIAPSKAAAAAVAAAELAGERVLSVPLAQVVPSPLQPRTTFPEELLSELVGSIRENGIIQPLIVRKVGQVLELIAGERRWRAAGQAGLEEVPVIVREATDLEVLELALVENLQRADLNPIEEATAYLRLAEEFKLKQTDEMARRMYESEMESGEEDGEREMAAGTESQGVSVPVAVTPVATTGNVVSQQVMWGTFRATAEQ